MHPVQAAPRQRVVSSYFMGDLGMHPVQAAPRQSFVTASGQGMQADAPRAGSAEAKPRYFEARADRPVDAPRAGSAEAKRILERLIEFLCDAPRAGSAKRNNNVPPDGSLTTGRHFFTFPPSRIPTVAPSSSVTMYNPAPIFLTDPAWRSRISPTVPMLFVMGRRY